MKMFKSGDIIQGTEGARKSWEDTATLLVVSMDSDGDAQCIELQRETRKGTSRERGARVRSWCLTCRDWKKIGFSEEMQGIQEKMVEAVRKWRRDNK